MSGELVILIFDSMKRIDWQEIRDAIYSALGDYDCTVYYHYPSSDGQCGYFSISIDDEYDEEDLDSCLSSVIDEYDLTWDDQSCDGDFDLNAEWDNYD
jgi:hypothetical protein